jgi:hypothetical protein
MMRSHDLTPRKSSWLAKHWQRVWLFGKRFTALASVALLIYVVVGSMLFGQWWCVFFWRGGYKDFEFIAYGLRVLQDLYFPLVLVTIAGFIVASIMGALLRHRLFSLTDKFAGMIIFVAIMTIVVDAVILYHIQYERLTVSRAGIAELRDWVHEMQAAFKPPQVNPPIYFHYLDSARVEALYNQIQPELEEKQRTVLRSSTLKGEAAAGVGDARLGIEGEKANESKSTFGRSDFSSDRKCVEVMRYVRETWPASYYTTASQWYLNIMLEEKADWYYELFSGWPIDPTRAKPALPLSEGTTEAREIEAAQPAERQTELRMELRSLRGLVFVDGGFQESANGESGILFEEFSERPFKASFRIFLPRGAIHDIPAKKSLHLTVFGDVIRPLGDDGVADIRAVAVY